MHSFAPIAGITSVSGIQRHAEAARVERARPPSRNSARPRFDGYWCVARVRDRRLRRGDDRRVGRRVRVADAERDHVDARRLLLGDLALELGEQVRRDPVEALTRSAWSSFRKSSESVPANTGTAQPVRLTCRSSPTSTVSSPPSSDHGHGRVAAAQHVRDRGAGRAGAGGERLADAALEDPRADAVRRQLGVPGDVRAVGEQLAAPRSRGPIAGRSSASSSSTESTRIAHCGLPIETCWKAPQPPRRPISPLPSSAPPG